MFFAAFLPRAIRSSDSTSASGPSQKHEREKQQKRRRGYSLYTFSSRTDPFKSTSSSKEAAGHGEHHLKRISKASIGPPVSQSPISLTGFDNRYVDLPPSPSIGVHGGSKPTTYENVGSPFQHPYHNCGSSISLQSFRSAVTRAGSRMHYHLPFRASTLSLHDDYGQQAGTPVYQNEQFGTSCTTFSGTDSRPQTPDDYPEDGLSPTEAFNENWPQPSEFGEIGIAIGSEEELDGMDGFYVPQVPRKPSHGRRPTNDSEFAPSPAPQPQIVTRKADRMLASQADPPLLSLLRLLRKKVSAPISMAVSKATIALMCEILDQGHQTEVTSELSSASDVQLLLDFTLHLIDNGYLRDVPVQGANRKARRLMCKLLSKTPVMPKSIFMTGVNTKLSSTHIGMGGFGCVFEGEYQKRRVALKVLYKVRRDDDFCREALVWRSLSHPYIIPLLGIYEERSLHFLVSPYMENGTLANWRNSQSPSLIDIESRIREIAEGVWYIHSEGIVHGDLRGANILLDSNFHSQIADFGLARHSDITATRSTTALSFNFAAPELFGACSTCDQTDEGGECPGCLHRPMKTPETDVYGFGCLYYEIHFNHIPFKGHGEAQIIRSVTTGKHPPRLQEPYLADSAWNLIERCWAMEPKARPTMSDVLSAMKAYRG